MPHRPFPYQRLLLVFLGIVLPVCVAGLIAEELHQGRPFAFETPLMLWLHRHTGQALLALSLALHEFGKPANATAFTVAVAAWQWYRGHPRRALLLALGAGLSTAVMHTAKLFFMRSRPELWPRWVEETSASFPSGHSTYAAALATALIIGHWHSPHRPLWLTGGILFALAMGLSRMVLGVHYPTDVLVGWITGAVCVISLNQLIHSHRLQAH